MNKLNKLTVEELMVIAKYPIKESDEFKNFSPVKRFIHSDKIMYGDIKIPAGLIYDRYLKWTNNYKIEKIAKNNFFKELSLYFNKMRTNGGIVYLMGLDGFDMSPENLQLVQSNMKRISNGKKTKIKKERKN